jgi:hypothetical protein
VDSKLKKRLAIGGVVVATFGAAGGAYAIAAGNDNPRDAYLNDVAGRLHVSRDQLDSALKGAFEDRLDAAVKAGKLTQKQADAIKQKIEQGGAAGVPGPGPGFGFGVKPFGGPGRFFGARPLVAGGFQAAAKYLGLTNAQLKQQLASGKSLAKIAGDQKKSVDGLKSAITDSVKSRLDAAVKSKKLTQQQEDNILKALGNRIDDIVNSTPPKLKGLRPGALKGPGRPHPAGAPGFFF